MGIGIVGLVPIGLEQIRHSFQDSAGPRCVLVNKPIGRRELLKALAKVIDLPAEPPPVPAVPPASLVAPAAPALKPGPFASTPVTTGAVASTAPSEAQPKAVPVAAPAPASSPFLTASIPASAVAPTKPKESAVFPPAPAAPAPAPAPTPAATPATGQEAANSSSFAEQHPARILLVEDQPMNQKLTRMMLNRLGYAHVDLAENGQEAVDLVHKRDYDVVLMDLQMPVMGGQDATREIRSDVQLKHQPVIVAVTGYALSGVRESCYQSGMNEFLTKPVSLDNLRDTLCRSLALSPS
jgi:CheY-like chemotaxis protein